MGGIKENLWWREGTFIGESTVEILEWGFNNWFIPHYHYNLYDEHKYRKETDCMIEQLWAMKAGLV